MTMGKQSNKDSSCSYQVQLPGAASLRWSSSGIRAVTQFVLGSCRSVLSLAPTLIYELAQACKAPDRHQFLEVLLCSFHFNPLHTIVWSAKSSGSGCRELRSAFQVVYCLPAIVKL